MRTDRPSRPPLVRLGPWADTRLDRPYPRLPRPLDALSERWARLRPRARLLVTVVAVLALAAAVQARVQRAEQRWGGPAVPVLVAQGDLPVGARDLDLRQVALPAAAVPPGAVERLPPAAALSHALPEGSVLTSAHLDPGGPAVGLAEGLRAVPIPVEEGWRIDGGGLVDVWVLGGGTEAAAQVAGRRPVLEVSDHDSGATALVGLDEGEVGPTSEGLALGRVLLTHVPP
ncbi:MAG: hypothetical protein GEU81_08170 [Nitriliruptorales bacterium]|nr:hypothetical protein [Nitriliruptorales bacterium]